jgi:hypothetical protein
MSTNNIGKAKTQLLILGGECRVSRKLYPEAKDKFEAIENVLGEIYGMLEEKGDAL